MVNVKKPTFYKMPRRFRSIYKICFNWLCLDNSLRFPSPRALNIAKWSIFDRLTETFWTFYRMVGRFIELADNVYNVQMFHRLLDLREHSIESLLPHINRNISNNHNISFVCKYYSNNIFIIYQHRHFLFDLFQ